MAKKSNSLRLNAEEELKKRKPEQFAGEGDTMRLIHELQVHQIELEMQNEELVLAREKAIKDLEKYINLYDFVPSGLLTISRDGIIVDLNYLAAKLLGNERRYLKNTSLELYIHPVGLMHYNQLMNAVFKSTSRKSGELFLGNKTSAPTCVLFDAISTENNDFCLISMTDITERKRVDDELRRKMNDLKEINDFFLNRELVLMDMKTEINELLTKLGCEEQYLI